MDFNKFKKIMSYCKQYGGATLDGFGRVVKFDSGYQVAYTDHAVKGRKAVRECYLILLILPCSLHTMRDYGLKMAILILIIVYTLTA